MNHRIFERKLHSLDIQGVCLSERRVKPKHIFCVAWEFLHLVTCKSLDVRAACSLNRRLNSLLSFWQCFKSLLPFSKEKPQHHWPQIRQDYPLNLSILISGGKETNQDSPSNGEWSGKSSSLKSAWFPCRIVVYGYIVRRAPGLNSLEWDPWEGERPVRTGGFRLLSCCISESGCLGVQL